jgi:hypothetical protein
MLKNTSLFGAKNMRAIFLAALVAAIAGCQAAGWNSHASADEAPPRVLDAVYQSPPDAAEPIRLVADQPAPRYPLAAGLVAGFKQRVPNPFPRFVPRPVPCTVPRQAPIVIDESTIKNAVADGIEKAVADLTKKPDEPQPKPIDEASIKNAVTEGIEKAVADLTKKPEPPTTEIKGEEKSPADDGLGILAAIGGGAISLAGGFLTMARKNVGI